MNRILTLVAAVLLTASLWAQAPQSFSYQAVVRGTNNTLVSNKQVGMKISLLKGSEIGTSVYSETHMPTSNENGLVSLAIGGGTKDPSSATFATIDWSNGPYFLKTETDPAGGTSYSLTSTSQLMSVPYALYAANSQPGSPGADGKDGLNGATGAKGDKGDAGADGLNGTTGAKGDKGDAGADGLNGETGIKGDKGDAGADGLNGTTGAKGDKGDAGADGLNGTTGAKGDKGDAGADGLNGETGAKGDKGDAGADGNGFSNGTATNQIMYWNGSAWVTLNPGSNGQGLTLCNGLLTWTTGCICPGKITSLNCAGVSENGSLNEGVVASGVSFMITYSGGNGGSYSSQSISSTGVVGLTATLQTGSFANGNGSLTFTVSGIPTSAGNALFSLNIDGQICSVSISIRPFQGPK